MKSSASYLCFLFIAVFISMSANCAMKTRNTTFYSFDYPTPTRESENPVRDTLMIYRFLLDRNVPLDNLIIAQTKNGKESTLKYQWEENPADMISELMLRDMQSSGLFEKAVDQLSNARYRYALEGTIKNLNGVIQDDKGKAVLEMEAIVTDFEAPPNSDKTILRKNYKIEVPAQNGTPDGIIKALNLAVKELSQRLRHDVRTILEKSGAVKHPIPDEIQPAAETRFARQF
jgi:ABC-type uncharacterized transport system auxiliary subunit